MTGILYHWLAMCWQNRPRRRECANCGLVGWSLGPETDWLCTPECYNDWREMQAMPF